MQLATPFTIYTIYWWFVIWEWTRDSVL